ncbi:hypothetical protein DIE28_07180 [Paracoccus thiocyanatus]|uniref:Uncharacterized protein n=1 Tax=Paracoccus thiocyanatus TaxID=34006 RepID=A0A3D8PEI8_9RHOB|nr:hypothetical protein DIE28_07180 [Paracoccus thiocyanatus]
MQLLPYPLPDQDGAHQRIALNITIVVAAVICAQFFCNLSEGIGQFVLIDANLLIPQPSIHTHLMQKDQIVADVAFPHIGHGHVMTYKIGFECALSRQTDQVLQGYPSRVLATGIAALQTLMHKNRSVCVANCSLSKPVSKIRSVVVYFIHRYSSQLITPAAGDQTVKMLSKRQYFKRWSSSAPWTTVRKKL